MEMYKPKTIVLAIDRYEIKLAVPQGNIRSGRMSGGFVPNSVVFATK